jgi:hypothetical protein
MHVYIASDKIEKLKFNKIYMIFHAWICPVQIIKQVRVEGIDIYTQEVLYMTFYLILIILLLYMYKYPSEICVYLLTAVPDLRMASSQDV